MKFANTRHALSFTLILVAIAAAVSIAYAGTHGRLADEAVSESPPPMMSIPF